MSGLEETIQAAQSAEKDLRTVMQREIRRELRPLVSDIKGRFRDLGGTGPRVATTVRSQVNSKGAAVRMGNAQHPYSLGREFGAKKEQLGEEKRTAAHFRTYQSGPMARRVVGGGQRRVISARIPYWKDSIFGPWTGNQFSLGESNGRLTVDQASGKAFYPAIGVGAQNVFERLKTVADKYADSFPAPVESGPSPIERMQSFLKAGGIGV